jgi:hypothetical protein
LIYSEIPKLDDILRDKPEDAEFLKVFLRGSILEPDVEIRSKVICFINKSLDDIFRGAYVKDAKIYIKIRNFNGGINTFYLEDVPNEYRGKSTEIYPFNLDAD